MQTQRLAALLLLLQLGASQGQRVSLQPLNVVSNTVLGGSKTQQAIWQVAQGTRLPVFNVSGGVRLTIQYAWLDISTSNITWSAQQWEDNLLLPSLVKLEPTASLVLNGLTIKTTCAHIVNITNQACKQLTVAKLSTLQVQARDVVVSSWSAGQLKATNVRFTCQTVNKTFQPVSSMAKDAGNGTEAQTTCGVAHVQTWMELSTATASLQTYADRAVIVVDADIDVGSGNRTDVPVHKDVEVVGNLNLTENVQLNFGYLRSNATWTLKDTGRLFFTGITFTTLPLGPYDKLPWSVIGWPMWMVNLDRCQDSQQVYVMNCTLVMPPETMDYMNYWMDVLSSPLPSVQATGSWFMTDNTCDPPLDNAFLFQRIIPVDASTWQIVNATSFGIRFIKSVFTGLLPSSAVVNDSPLQLTKLFADPFKPLIEITWVETPAQLLQAFQLAAADAVVILKNISMSDLLMSSYPEGVTIRLVKPINLSGWPARPTYLDFQRRPNVFKLNSPLTIRNMVLMNGAQGTNSSVSSWTADLTMLQWSFQFPRVQQLLELIFTTIILPPSEFRLLQLAANAQQQSTPNSNQQTATSDGQMFLAMFSDTGVVGYNITLASQPPDTQMPFPSISRVRNTP